MKKITLVLLLILLLGSCERPLKENNFAKSREYVDTGFQLITKAGYSLFVKQDTLAYLKAANYYQKAIACDSNNMDAFNNLVQTYYKLDSNRIALRVVNKLLHIKPNYVEAVKVKGFLLERMGKQLEANSAYKKAIQMYSQKANKTYSDAINKACLIMMLYGKKKGLKELYRIKREYPDSKVEQYNRSALYPAQNVKTFINLFKNFNRSDFIKNALN